MTATLESLRAALQLAAKERSFTSTRDESKTETIRSLKREIAELRKKGASWKQVADILATDGLQASADTVRLAMQKKKPKPPATSAQDVPPPAPTGNTFGAAGREF